MPTMQALQSPRKKDAESGASMGSTAGCCLQKNSTSQMALPETEIRECTQAGGLQNKYQCVQNGARCHSICQSQLELSCFQEDGTDIIHSILLASQSPTLEMAHETNRGTLKGRQTCSGSCSVKNDTVVGSCIVFLILLLQF